MDILIPDINNASIIYSETKTFVDQLFESLESKEYVKQAALVVQQTPTVVTEATTTTTTSTTQVTADNEIKTEIKKKDDTSVKQVMLYHRFD